MGKDEAQYTGIALFSVCAAALYAVLTVRWGFNRDFRIFRTW